MAEVESEPALAVFLLGQALAIWAARSNPFFSDFVRIQTDRGHYVVATGPYAWVRHPGYAGGGPSYAAVPILLGSLWGLVPALIGLALLAVRAAREDRILQVRLAGDAEYAACVVFLAKIDAGLKELDAGKGIPHDEVHRRFSL